MLNMKNVSKVYRTDTVETHALREFSLTVEEGEFVSVTGPSGSGKTTFLNIAGLLEDLSGGIYELDGRDISTASTSSMVVISPSSTTGNAHAFATRRSALFSRAST
jgi:putative ABC transport system ATP-binding protein